MVFRRNRKHTNLFETPNRNLKLNVWNPTKWIIGKRSNLALITSVIIGVRGGKGGVVPWILKFDVLITFSAKKNFFSRGKNEISQLSIPLWKNRFFYLWKMHYLPPLEKSFRRPGVPPYYVYFTLVCFRLRWPRLLCLMHGCYCRFRKCLWKISISLKQCFWTFDESRITLIITPIMLCTVALPAQECGRGQKIWGGQYVWFQANNTILFGKPSLKAQNDYIF